MTTILLWSCLILFTAAVTVLAVWACWYAWQLHKKEKAQKYLFSPNLAVNDYRHAEDALATLWKTEQPNGILFILFPLDSAFLLGMKAHRRHVAPKWIPAILAFARDLNIQCFYTHAVFTMQAPNDWFLKDSGIILKEIGVLAETYQEQLLVIGIDTEQGRWCHFSGRGVPK